VADLPVVEDQRPEVDPGARDGQAQPVSCGLVEAQARWALLELRATAARGVDAIEPARTRTAFGRGPALTGLSRAGAWTVLDSVAAVGCERELSAATST
jgi:hypothetical protein